MRGAQERRVLRSSPSQARRTRCPLCREWAEGADRTALACAGCATPLHRACLQELTEGRCPTAGCGRRLLRDGAIRGPELAIQVLLQMLGIISFLLGAVCALKRVGPAGWLLCGGLGTIAFALALQERRLSAQAQG